MQLYANFHLSSLTRFQGILKKLLPTHTKFKFFSAINKYSFSFSFPIEHSFICMFNRLAVCFSNQQWKPGASRWSMSPDMDSARVLQPEGSNQDRRFPPQPHHRRKFDSRSRLVLFSIFSRFFLFLICFSLPLTPQPEKWHPGLKM